MIVRKVSVLGSTGSVGTSTLDLMDQAEKAGSGTFQVEVLTGGNNIARLAEQARRWRPKLAVTANPARLSELRDALAGTDVEVAAGPEAIVEAASRPVDWVMASIVGGGGAAFRLGGGRHRRDPGPGQQGKSGLLRPGAYRTGQAQRRQADPCRLRTFRHLPGLSG